MEDFDLSALYFSDIIIVGFRGHWMGVCVCGALPPGTLLLL